MQLKSRLQNTDVAFIAIILMVIVLIPESGKQAIQSVPASLDPEGRDPGVRGPDRPDCVGQHHQGDQWPLSPGRPGDPARGRGTVSGVNETAQKEHTQDCSRAPWAGGGTDLKMAIILGINTARNAQQQREPD